MRRKLLKSLQNGGKLLNMTYIKYQFDLKYIHKFISFFILSWKMPIWLAFWFILKLTWRKQQLQLRDCFYCVFCRNFQQIFFGFFVSRSGKKTVQIFELQRLITPSITFKSLFLFGVIKFHHFSNILKTFENF